MARLRLLLLSGLLCACSDRSRGPSDAPGATGEPPAIESVQPWEGAPGDTVQVTGREFDPAPGATLAAFGGAPADISALTSGSLSLLLPPGALTGPVRVTTPQGTATSALHFIVADPQAAAPRIVSVTPLGGPPGSTVLLRGSGFQPERLANHVRFGEGLAEVSSASDTLLTVTVPPAATSGPLSLVTPGGRTQAPVAFVLHEGDSDCQTPTLVAGTLPGSLNWSRAGCPYVLLEEVRIPPGARVMVEDGVVIKLLGSEARLVVEGELVIEGLPGAPVVFTSYRDDARAGDTNGDASATAAAAGDWDRVEFLPGATGDLAYVEFRHGGAGGMGAAVLNAEVRLDHAVIAHNAGYGLVAASAPVTTTVTACDFFGNARPLLIHPSLPVDPAHRFSPAGETPNAQDGIFLAQGATAAGETVWGATARPYVISAPGPAGDVFVGGASTLRILPGVTVKLDGPRTNLIVLGELAAEGTAANPVAFTSFRDDTRGGDTNGDGAATSPARGDWDSIDLGRYSRSVFTHAEIVYGGSLAAVSDGALVALAGSRAQLVSTRVQASAANGIMIFGGGGTVQGCVFVFNARSAIRLAEADAWYGWGGETLQGANQFSGNGSLVTIGTPP